MNRWLLLAALTTQAIAQTTVPAPKPIIHPVFPHGEGTALAATVTQVLADPEVARAHVGIAVTTLDGTPLYGLNEAQLFRPASNAKLFTTVAAMALLGPDSTVSTNVFGNLDPKGTVAGNLVLKGAGDASFGTEDLPYLAPADASKEPARAHTLKDIEELADKLVAKGLKHVKGGVVGDDMSFFWQPYPQGWDADDLLWGYGAPVSALSVADNQLKLTISPGPAPAVGAEKAPDHLEHHKAQVELEDFGIPFYSVQSSARQTTGVPSVVDVDRAEGQNILRVYGQMDSQAKPDTEEIAITDPALFAARALEIMLKRKGVTFGAEATSRHREVNVAEHFLAELQKVDLQPEGKRMFVCAMSPPGTPLVSHVSLPLREDVKFTMKVSQNLHAELLLRRLSASAVCDQSSTLDGAITARRFLIQAGLDGNDFVFYDGSGLSTHDLVTPRATAQLLTYASTQPWFPQWKSALPVAGVDGSLSSRFKDSPLKGHVYAKTGTLGESRALSGYVDCASGKTVAFSIFIDTHLPGHSEGDVIDKIVTAIAANN